jgi:hypothetical protein
MTCSKRCSTAREQKIIKESFGIGEMERLEEIADSMA